MCVCVCVCVAEARCELPLSHTVPKTLGAVSLSASGVPLGMSFPSVTNHNLKAIFLANENAQRCAAEGVEL